MPYNGAGTFTRVYDWTTDRDAAVKIQAERMDTEMDGFATGLSTAITKDGQTTITANLPMSGFKHTGVASGSGSGSRSEYVSGATLQDGAPLLIGSVAGTNTITGSLSPAIAAYAAGQTFRFVAAGANTGATTLNLNGVGAKNVYKAGASGLTALASGDIQSGQVVEITYDGTQFVMMSPAAGTAIPDGGISTAKLADDAVTYAKLQNISATSRILGRKTASAGDAEEITASEALDFVGSTRGSILYRGASGWAILAPGTSGHALKSNGAGADPSYADLTTSAASQAEQEASTENGKMVTPLVQQYHPSAAKAWVRFNTSGTVGASYNITSITDSGAGNWTVNIATDFSSANFAGVAIGGYKTSGSAIALVYGIGAASAAGTFTISALQASDSTNADPAITEIHACFFGDQ